VIRGIDYLLDECPMALGNRHLSHKNILNEVERNSPGAKASFYLNFIEKMAPVLAARGKEMVESLGSCDNCGRPTTGTTCAFCRVVATSAAHQPVPVEVVLSKKARLAYLRDRQET
jgi:tRNA(Ile)-lysidine synthase TilS/MesJ